MNASASAVERIFELMDDHEDAGNRHLEKNSADIECCSEKIFAER